MRKAFTLICIAILIILVFLLNTPPLEKQLPEDINVILLTIDSIRPDRLGCYGYQKMTSPNIDHIAENGQVFRLAFSQSAWTMPGIMSILTSLQPPVHKVEQRGDLLDPSITTIFDCFNEAGYTVPNICFLLTVPEFSTIRIGPSEEEYFSDKDDDELFRWLEENHGEKFFMWYHHRAVHLPYRPSRGAQSIFLPNMPDESELTEGVKAILSDAAVVPVGSVEFEQSDAPIINGLYDGEIKDLDSFVGRLYAKLRKLGLVDNTLVVLTADHGEELLDHGFVGHASTMHSATLYDEVIRIPLIISLPGHMNPGMEIREQIQQIDIMPTILNLADIPVPPGVQGRSLAPLLLKTSEQKDTSLPVFAETVFGGYQATDWMTKTRLRSIRTDTWKLIETESPEGNAFQMFNLLIDPKEHINVFEENPKEAERLMALLSEWKRENSIISRVLASADAATATTAEQTVCPEMLFPYDQAVLRFEERNGTIKAAWTGSPTSTYIVEYEIGTGIHHLTGAFATYGNRRDFGPYSRDIWKSVAVRNPWRVRVSPDTRPRCWSEWIEFTFE